MFRHWDKAAIALADNDDVCLEWDGPHGYFWLDIERDGTVRTLRGYPKASDGKPLFPREEKKWKTAQAVEMCGYVNTQLDAVYAHPSPAGGKEEGNG